jgi:hypothetical protein
MSELLESLVAHDIDATDNQGRRLADLLRDSDPRAYNRAVLRNAKRLATPTLPRMTKAQLREVAPQLLQAVRMMEEQERELREQERSLRQLREEERTLRERIATLRDQEREASDFPTGDVMEAEVVEVEGDCETEHAAQDPTDDCDPLRLRPLNRQAKAEAQSHPAQQAQGEEDVVYRDNITNTSQLLAAALAIFWLGILVSCFAMYARL